MFKKINSFAYHWAISNNPWTSAYGVARSLIALSTLVTLIFNDVSTLFRPVAGVEEFPACSIYSISIFCLGSGSYLGLFKWLAALILLLVVSGWRPRYTGVLHWWVASSIQNTAITLDGGEQVATVLTLLLIPVTLLDKRKWHWETGLKETTSNSQLHFRIISLVFLVAVKIQMSFIYFQAAIIRLKNSEWLDGTAVYYYFNDPMLGLNNTLANILNPLLASPFVFFITWGTTIIELFLAASLIGSNKYWKIYLYSGVLLHAGIAIVLGLHSFSIIMCAGLILSYYPLNREFKFISKLNSLKTNSDKDVLDKKKFVS
ncbi:sporulation-delaying protein SdpB family protein [Bacillus thuringiensis]|uniref:sporulation-delaying protein SdpB family protein n=1 Tax=Bacillus thuringiensis TaxID=1428 RepID=UPI001EDCE9E4|nr:sporulation-delaying protein SdpB family protein [Bacillus thuringiensis]MCG3426410.1 hypothetical protein [Bacillus thuringiensis]